MKPVISEIKFNGQKCINFSNNIIDLCIAKDFGPRILFIGFQNETNLFAVSDIHRKTSLGNWKIYGGHRLWIAPEKTPETYYPDNNKVNIIEKNGKLIVSQLLNKLEFTKEIEISFVNNNKIQVLHRIHNLGKKELKFSIWPISVMRKNGFAIIPQNNKKEDEFGHLPNRNLVFWTYTNYHDSRIKMTEKYLYIKQKGKNTFKIGQRVPMGWCAYYYKGYLFKKNFTFDYNQMYLDFGANVEIYANKDYLELETLSPFVKLSSNKSFAYTEIWEISKNKKIQYGDNNIKL